MRQTASCAAVICRWQIPFPRRAKLRFTLLEPIVNPTFGQIVRRHFDLNLVASQNADAVLAHLACRVRDDLMAVFQLDPKRRIWQKFFYDTWEFEQFFLGHVIS
jgi:hypothetical protein